MFSGAKGVAQQGKHMLICKVQSLMPQGSLSTNVVVYRPTTVRCDLNPKHFQI